MMTLFLTELNRYKTAIAITVASVVAFAILVTLWNVHRAEFAFSVLGFCYLLSLLIAFVGGRIYDYGSDDFRFLAAWPQSRTHLFMGRLLSHLLMTGLTIVLLYVVAIAAMMLSGSTYADLFTEEAIAPTTVPSVALFCIIFAFSAFWSQFTSAAMSLLMAFISVIAFRYFIATGLQYTLWWRDAADSPGPFARMFDIPGWITLGLALLVIVAAGVGFMRTPLLEVRRRAFRSSGIVMLVLAVLGLLSSLDATNWLGSSEVRYRAVEIGMYKSQVTMILRAPHQRYLRSALGPRLSDYIHPPSNGREQPPNGQHEARLRADEVWRWWYPIDQKTYVVFDNNGRVIFKWIDY